ncbi:hypothetical protein JHK84_027838 [Glycine max]|nr:hypothetical protein JHK86_027717 [Glycine max]KAG5151366.1 hypothetical protein JHK84_027838 [Glycine max]
MGATEDMAARKEMTEKTMVQRMLSEMMTAVEEEHYPGAAEAESLRSLFVGRDQDHDPADKIMDQGLKMYDQIVDSGESDGVAKHQTAEPVVVSAGGEEPGLLVMAVMPAEKVNHGKAVAEPIQLLPAGLDSDSEPPDTCMDRSARANDRYKVSTDSAGTTNHRIVDYGGDNIGVEEPELHDLGVERPYGIQTHVRKKENKHEEGNVGTEGIVKAFEKSEPQIKEARDKGEGAIKEQVVATRQDRKISTHMQTSDQEQEAHHNLVEKSLQQGADQDNNHISEAEKLWQMAKELGVSYRFTKFNYRNMPFTNMCLILELASCPVQGAKDNLIEIFYNFTINSFQATDESVLLEAYNTLCKILEENPCFSSSQYIELIDLLHGLKPPNAIASLRSRFACFHMLIVHAVKVRIHSYEL